MVEERIDSWNIPGDENVSKQIYEVFKSEETQTRRFYADLNELKKGKLELSISEFTQEMISDFVKNMPKSCDMVVILEYTR
jgi:hypothetical protein